MTLYCTSMTTTNARRYIVETMPEDAETGESAYFLAWDTATESAPTETRYASFNAAVPEVAELNAADRAAGLVYDADYPFGH